VLRPADNGGVRRLCSSAINRPQGALPPAPALGERRHRSLACRFVASTACDPHAGRTSTSTNLSSGGRRPCGCGHRPGAAGLGRVGSCRACWHGLAPAGGDASREISAAGRACRTSGRARNIDGARNAKRRPAQGSELPKLPVAPIVALRRDQAEVWLRSQLRRAIRVTDERSQIRSRWFNHGGSHPNARA
jgi:hypothetical protein